MDSTHSFSNNTCISTIARPPLKRGPSGDRPDVCGMAGPAVLETLPSEASNPGLVDLGILLVWVILLIQCAFPGFDLKLL